MNKFLVYGLLASLATSTVNAAVVPHGAVARRDKTVTVLVTPTAAAKVAQSSGTSKKASSDSSRTITSAPIATEQVSSANGKTVSSSLSSDDNGGDNNEEDPDDNNEEDPDDNNGDDPDDNNEDNPEDSNSDDNEEGGDNSKSTLEDNNNTATSTDDESNEKTASIDNNDDGKKTASTDNSDDKNKKTTSAGDNNSKKTTSNDVTKTAGTKTTKSASPTSTTASTTDPSQPSCSPNDDKALGGVKKDDSKTNAIDHVCTVYMESPCPDKDPKYKDQPCAMLNLIPYGGLYWTRGDDKKAANTRLSMSNIGHDYNAPDFAVTITQATCYEYFYKLNNCTVDDSEDDRTYGGSVIYTIPGKADRQVRFEMLFTKDASTNETSS